jgi:hypothetical protein
VAGGVSGGAHSHRRELNAFFLKKEAKTFANWCARCSTAHTKSPKFFGSFFQKRTAFFLPQ